MHTLVEFFQRLYHFDELIRWGGHLVLITIVFSETGLMAGFFLPGDSLLVTAGLFAAAGKLGIVQLIAELLLAAALGDSLNYFVGRKLGPKIFIREKSLLFQKDHLIRTRHFYEKYGAKTVIIAKFVPIVRTFAPVVAGVGDMTYRKFLLFDSCGVVAWVFSMIMVGFYLGRSVPHIDKHIHELIFIIIFLSVLPAFIEFVKSRRSSKGELVK